MFDMSLTGQPNFSIRVWELVVQLREVACVRHVFLLVNEIPYWALSDKLAIARILSLGHHLFELVIHTCLGVTKLIPPLVLSLLHSVIDGLFPLRFMLRPECIRGTAYERRDYGNEDEGAGLHGDVLALGRSGRHSIASVKHRRVESFCPAMTQSPLSDVCSAPETLKSGAYARKLTFNLPVESLKLCGKLKWVGHVGVSGMLLVLRPLELMQRVSLTYWMYTNARHASRVFTRTGS